MKINTFLFASIVGLFSVVPAFVGVLKLRSINKIFRPFIFLVLVYCFINLFGNVCIIINKAYLNTVITNLFVLFDFIYIYFIISYWGDKKIKLIDYIIIFLFLLLWIFDNVIISNLLDTNSVFRIIYSLAISMRSISLLIYTISKYRNRLFSNSIFLISLTFMVYYTYKGVYEILYMFSSEMHIDILKAIHFALLSIIFISYILFTIAILCMKKPIKLITPY